MNRLFQIEKYGGKFYHISQVGAREVSFTLNGRRYTIDPNRIFTIPGITKTLKNYNNYSDEARDEVNKFAKFILGEVFKDSNLVIAVHNNSNGAYSIRSYRGEYSNDADAIYVSAAFDEDDFFFTVREKEFEYIKSKGFNVALQANNKVRDDGSLSVYCGIFSIPYVNVEAESGHKSMQDKMLEIFINYKK